ncbi:MAG: sigma-70 family RNA polymerase sigma factor, partial [Ruminococcus sp.]|nr:sigma-70 family RNA polymerase sigma factor [Ruminococcus sp.]
MDNGASSYRRFLDGDQEGMVEIICEYREGLTFYLYRFTNDIGVAEEITEDTFVKLCTRRPRFSGKSSFKTWLYTIGRNCALNYMKRRRFVSDTPLHEYTRISDGMDIEAEYIDKERGVQVQNAVKRLRPEYQQVLYLLYNEEFSTEETARIMH